MRTGIGDIIDLILMVSVNEHDITNLRSSL